MLSKINIILYLFSLSLSAKVVPFIPKVSIKSLRGFDEKNDSTIAQNSQNALIFYKGTKSKILFPKADFQNFQVIYNNFEYLLIEKDSSFSSEFNIRKVKDFYIIRPDGSGLSLIGKGSYADIHWNGSIVSIVNPYNKIISFFSTQTKSLIKRVSYSSGSNPFFLPKTFMRPSGDIFFTQVTSQNKSELIFINKKNRRSKIYQSKSSNLRISFCFNSNNEIRILLAKQEQDQKTKSYILNDALKTIYSTHNNLSGEVICKNNDLYFVQENDENAPLPPYQLLSIKKNSKEIIEEYKSNSSIEIFEHKRDIFLINSKKYFKVL